LAATAPMASAVTLKGMPVTSGSTLTTSKSQALGSSALSMSADLSSSTVASLKASTDGSLSSSPPSMATVEGMPKVVMGVSTIARNQLAAADQTVAKVKTLNKLDLSATNGNATTTTTTTSTPTSTHSPKAATAHGRQPSPEEGFDVVSVEVRYACDS
jgi:hypothetical protein